MRTILCAAVVACLTVPAFSQEMNLLQPNWKLKTEDEVKQQERTDKAYNATIKKLPDDADKKRDPWGNVRASGTAQTEQTRKNQKKNQTGAQ